MSLKNNIAAKTINWLLRNVEFNFITILVFSTCIMISLPRYFHLNMFLSFSQEIKISLLHYQSPALSFFSQHNSFMLLLSDFKKIVSGIIKAL